MFQSGGKGRRTRQKVTEPHISELMGQANMAYVKNDYETVSEATASLCHANEFHSENTRMFQAIRLLMDVIRQVPDMTEPYHTLGLIHESTGQVRDHWRSVSRPNSPTESIRAPWNIPDGAGRPILLDRGSPVQERRPAVATAARDVPSPRQGRAGVLLSGYGASVKCDG